MHFNFDETVDMVAESARHFAQKTLRPSAATTDHDQSIPKENLKALADLGFFGINLPDELGGVGAGTMAYSRAMIEIAKGCASTAVTMAVTSMVGEVIALFGSDQQKKFYCPKLCDGTLQAGAFALSEPGAGSDPGAMITTARQDGDEWVIDGTKQWITSGEFAGVFVVWARTGEPGPKGISTFLVDAGTKGLVVGPKEKKMGLRGSPTNQVVFEQCRVPKAALLGQLGAGFRVAMTALDGGRIGIASQAIGIAEASQEAAIAYAKDRKTFGEPIASKQAVQWMLADNATDIDAAKMLTFRAASLKDAKKAFSREAAMAKLWSSEMACRVCDRALQVHGGYGYTEDYEVERHYRDVRVTRIYEGTSEIQRIVIGRSTLQA